MDVKFAEVGILPFDDDPFAIGGDQHAIDGVAAIVVGHHPNACARRQQVRRVVLNGLFRTTPARFGQRFGRCQFAAIAVSDGPDPILPGVKTSQSFEHRSGQMRCESAREPNVHVGGHIGDTSGVAGKKVRASA